MSALPIFDDAETERQYWNYQFSRGHFEPSLFTNRQLREIDRQMEGRPRRIRRLARSHANVLDEIERSLVAVSRTSRGRTTFVRVPAHMVDPRCQNLADFARASRCGPEGENFSVGLAWCLRHARGDEALLLTALVAMRPALERTLTLVDLAGTDEFVMSDLLADLLSQLPLMTTDLAGLVRERKSTSRRELRQRRFPVDDAPTLAFPSDETTNRRYSGPTVAQMMDAATQAGVITEDDASVLTRTYVDGESLHALAAQLHVPYKTLQGRRWRSGRRVAGFLRREGLA